MNAFPCPRKGCAVYQECISVTAGGVRSLAGVHFRARGRSAQSSQPPFASATLKVTLRSNSSVEVSGVELAISNTSALTGVVGRGTEEVLVEFTVLRVFEVVMAVVDGHAPS